MKLPDFLPAITPGLYLVSVPIGNRGDMTLRGIHVLSGVDLILCEDTRTSRPLLETFSIKTPLKAFHEHNEEASVDYLIEQLKAGKSIALISDAGTPLISDPGYKLVRACRAENLDVTGIPGPSSVINALVLSGMPTDHFMFCGFVDPKKLTDYRDMPATLVFFESAQRIVKTLELMTPIFRGRHVAVAREMTKLFEEVITGTFDQVKESLVNRDKILGEIVMVLSPPGEGAQDALEDLDSVLLEALKTHSVKDACTLVAGALGLPKKQVYARALDLQKK